VARQPKLLGDAELRKLVLEFFGLAQRNVIRTTEELRQAFASGTGFRLREGISFRITDELREAQGTVIGRAVRLLGHRRGSEKDVEDVLWTEVASIVCGDQALTEDVVALRVINAISNNADIEYRVLFPNFVLRFVDGVRSISIGPVIAALTEDVANELESAKLQNRWKLVVDAELGMLIAEPVILYRFPPHCWDVRLVASKSNSEEESAWLADIALSLLRLLPVDLGPLNPNIGATEAAASRKPLEESYALRITSEGMSGGGLSRLGVYTIGKAAADLLAEAEVINRMGAVLSPSQGSLGERLAQGLGWMTRGRRAAERAERFLMFFTAVEALLSSDDKTAPVVQTIARHAGVIWSNNVDERLAISNEVKSLYGTRSALIHAGSRNIMRSDADKIQYIVEALYSKVLSEMPPKMRYQDFYSSLSSASHGAAWPSPTVSTAAAS
jgi:hypothetical protein